MAEREEYNPETGQWEFVNYDDGGMSPTPPSSPAPPARGPNWIPPLPTTPPREGYQWIIDPNTNEWVETIRGTHPSTNDRPGFDYTKEATAVDRFQPVVTPGGPVTTYGGPGGGPGAAAGFDGGGNFNWSQFNPERFSFASYVPKFGAYSSPTMEEAESEPGYAFGRDQGRKVLENSRAGAGVLRTGGTLKDILEYGNQFATQNYAGVDQRKHRNWQSNTDQDVRAYTTNRDTAFGVYDRNYRGDLDSFNATRRGEELNFSDQYNRWRDRLSSLTSITTAGMNS